MKQKFFYIITSTNDPANHVTWTPKLVLYRSMRTRRQRKWYTLFGMMLWVTGCVLAAFHINGVATGFIVATGIWAVTVIAYIVRDHWENRP